MAGEKVAQTGAKCTSYDDNFLYAWKIMTASGWWGVIMPQVTARQIRAARALLEWSQETLADHAIVSRNSVYRIERGEGTTTEVFFKVTQALEDAGIEFQHPDQTKDEGVRLNSPLSEPS
jgi:DNA-binding XRE family transcriptional regulator